ncbi:uncharacterized protein PG998_004726 [Apiospora kogelbergensis]|uniref:uncharacterized protein n=1 Tax=Apiospora kogelbergensis TaxID=1337665 RepID=UPI0031325FBA
MAGKRSEHHPERPTWTTDDLDQRWQTQRQQISNHQTEAEAAGRSHLDFLVNCLYGRVVALLEDVHAARAESDAGAPRRHRNALRQIETNIIYDLNRMLRGPFFAAADAEGAFDPRNEENTAHLRTLMRDFRWLQNASGLEMYASRLAPHFQWMQEFINDCLPVKESLWQGGDLQSHRDFEELWQEFVSWGAGASHRPQEERSTDLENRKLVENSQNILRDAFDALLLNPDEMEVEWEDLQGDRADVPSYLTQPPWTEAFWAGAGNDGARWLMDSLGCDGDARECLSRRGPEQGAVNEKVVSEVNNNNSSSSSKRSAPHDQRILFGGVTASTPAAKRPKTEADADSTVYTEGESEEEDDGVDEIDECYDDTVYTLDDAINDVMHLRVDCDLEPPMPKGTLFVTPTVRIPEPFKTQYQPELAASANQYDAPFRYLQDLQYDEVSEEPTLATDPVMAMHLAQLQHDLVKEERTLKAAHDEAENDPAHLKQWCISAWRMRYLRSLQLALMAMTGATVEDNEFDMVYDRRLEDWIENEMAWIATDEYAIDNLLRSEPAKREACERIKARQENVSEWEGFLKQGHYLVDDVNDDDEESYRQRALNAPPHVDIRLAPHLEQSLREAEDAIWRDYEQKGPPAYRIKMNGPILGSLKYDTTGPNANRPAADPNSRAQFAQGGPYGYMSIPTGTVYEKLQYMIILTFWRSWMAADTGL